MGGYYSGMMNNKDGYGELRHFGILGMKWGVRRFQNKDGSLTPEGRERYYGKTGQKEFAKELNDGKFNIKNAKRGKYPQITDAARRIQNSSTNKERMRLMKDNEQIEKSFYENEKLYNKYVDKAVDSYIKRNPEILKNKYINNDKSKLKDYFLYDDFDQGDESSFALWIRSGDKNARKYIQNEKTYTELSRKLYKEARSISKEILGDMAKNPLNRVKGRTYPPNMNTLEDQLANILFYNFGAI